MEGHLGALRHTPAFPHIHYNSSTPHPQVKELDSRPTREKKQAGALLQEAANAALFLDMFQNHCLPGQVTSSERAIERRREKAKAVDSSIKGNASYCPGVRLPTEVGRPNLNSYLAFLGAEADKIPTGRQLGDGGSCNQTSSRQL